VEKIYYESGILKGEAPFNDGRENGVEKQYYESGKIWYETTYVGDKKMERIKNILKVGN
jgi:antitoxin component YwqK of YwqJK toxin-antitoxin module